MPRSKRSNYFDDEKETKMVKKSHKTDNFIDQSTRLLHDFFSKYSTIDLAKNLLGKILCREIDGIVVKGIIVETEAYLGVEDHASYTFGGRRTDANEPMYMPAGTCFIRFTYGMYYCFNISSQDFGGAVLLRAIEPLEGIEKMIELRQNHPKSPKINFATKPNQLANGPSKLCICFKMDRAMNKVDITNDAKIWIENNDSKFDECDIIESTRIGISPKNEWSKKLLRYYLKGNKSVSKF